MKPISLFFLLLLLCLLSIGTISHGRKEAGDYWKSIMKDQPMPDSIKSLYFQQNPRIPLSDKENANKFVKDFDVGRNAIIYHSRRWDDHNVEKVHIKDYKPKLMKEEKVSVEYGSK
ncbi:hypothetical protein HS088_TW02G00124 [Tripterygium wilfordii]|uniref:Organ-specific protein P4-like n=1 Tax=Tripterygium wilfordii TaxID=458696 RepID=A0A7J7DY64_TRIWF|nr:organ-specific protein P4-like [Tripterygium wilfordii]KAF5751114.1 hypothetical protein HS088_TW02G00124 [Tripterygium wilfordii]